MKLMQCPKCEGTGKVLDPRAEGEVLRKYRQKCAVSLREMSRRLGVSAAYLSDIELGKRGHQGAWMEKYIASNRA